MTWLRETLEMPSKDKKQPHVIKKHMILVVVLIKYADQ
jgi:hypothetical protein